MSHDSCHENIQRRVQPSPQQILTNSRQQAKVKSEMKAFIMAKSRNHSQRQLQTCYQELPMT